MQKHGSDRMALTKAMCKREWLFKGPKASVADIHRLLSNMAVKGPDGGKAVMRTGTPEPGFEPQLLHPASCIPQGNHLMSLCLCLGFLICNMATVSFSLKDCSEN